MPSNHVHKHNGKWYFWDETGQDRHGPYDTKAIARKRLKEYLEWLGVENVAGDI